MKTGINLITTKQTFEKNIRRFFLVSIIFFAAIFVITSILLAFNFILNRNLADLQTQKNSLNNSFVSLSDKSAKFLLLTDRLSNIRSILMNRQDIISKIDSIFALFPQRVLISGLGLDNDGFTVRVQSEDLSALDKSIRDMRNLDPKKSLLKRIDITSFAIDERGFYSSTIKFVFAK
jgi:hypothetical protein